MIETTSVNEEMLVFDSLFRGWTGYLCDSHVPHAAVDGGRSSSWTQTVQPRSRICLVNTLYLCTLELDKRRISMPMRFFFDRATHFFFLFIVRYCFVLHQILRHQHILFRDELSLLCGVRPRRRERRLRRRHRYHWMNWGSHTMIFTKCPHHPIEVTCKTSSS